MIDIEIQCVRELHIFERQLRERRKTLSELQSKYDQEQQDILHYIEFYRYSAVDGSKLIKKLKEIRLKRREVAAENEQVRLILERLTDAKLANYTPKKKKYTLKTGVIDECLK